MSPSSVAYQLKELERKGYLRRDPNRPRAVDVRPPSELMAEDEEAVRAARDLVARGRAWGGSGVALVLGGETTVTLRGETGRGGRNQELALAAARELSGGEGELVLTLATDGEDGPTRSAGGTVDGTTWEAVRRAGIDPEAALARHDSGTALAAVPGQEITLTCAPAGQGARLAAAQ